MRVALTLLGIASALAGCERGPEPPRYASAYPGQPVQSVVGTNYAAYPGLPAPPVNEEGVVPPPPPRYTGESSEASSANVVRP